MTGRPPIGDQGRGEEVVGLSLRNGSPWWLKLPQTRTKRGRRWIRSRVSEHRSTQSGDSWLFAPSLG